MVKIFEGARIVVRSDIPMTPERTALIKKFIDAESNLKRKSK